jgi:serine/threonine protein kinase
MAENSDSLLGQIPRYEIRERIGTGGMARVYRAYDTALDRDVAVKVLHEHLADDALFRARFEREAKFIASFNHPNVVQIFDYATLESGDSHLCYMVMTYLSGKTLKQVIDEHHEADLFIAPEQVLSFVKNIAAALDYAHGLGMVHRDIKPANILFDEHEKAVLTDFGIARLAESSKLTQENVAVGTPAYMAPEQAAGDHVDARTDIYAFGVILYELLAGKPPFGDDGSISVLIKHLNQPVPPLTDLDHIDSDLVDAVVMKALAKSPDDRYQRAGDLADDLEQALAGKMPLAMNKGQGSRESAAYLGTSGALPSVGVSPEPERRSVNTIPLGILAVGLALMLVVMAVAFFANQQPVTVVVAPTLEQPPVPTGTPTLNPADFRNFGGIDSMVEEEPPGVSSMTSADNMGFRTEFSSDDDIINYWSLETVMSGAREGEITRELTDTSEYVVTNSIRNLVATSIVGDFYYTEDISIVADMRLAEMSEDISGYGLVFHYVDESNYGVFAIDGVGRYSIWYLEDGRWRELRNLSDRWTESSAINLIGSDNRLRLDIRGSTLTGMVNGEEVVQIEDDSLSEGGVGLYLANPNREGAVATLVLDMYEVIMADEGASISSMTESEG